MSGTVNKIILIGRLGKDPDVSYGTTGNAICKFSLATDDGYGERKKTNWHSIVIFGKTAEVAGQYLKKGSSCYLEGRVDYREHEGKWYTSIVGDHLTLLGGRSDGQVRHGNDGAGEDESNLPF